MITIRGTTTLIAHIGYPTEAFKAPMIFNLYFEANGIDAVVMPMGVEAEDYAIVLPSIFKLTNIRGALITMPHKVTTVDMVDEVTPTAKIAGARNAILRRPDGSLLGDMFDGAGFVRGIQRKGLNLTGKRVLVVGSGGVGCAIAASLAAAALKNAVISDFITTSPTKVVGAMRETSIGNLSPGFMPIGVAFTTRS